MAPQGRPLKSDTSTCKTREKHGPQSGHGNKAELYLLVVDFIRVSVRY